MTEPIEPLQFAETSEGSGAFGTWILDEDGLPAYRYDLDQHRSATARYEHSFGLDRRDHWHQIGNDRITALASNEGTVQVLIADRGPVFLNHFEAPEPRTLKGRGLLLLRWLARQYYERRKTRVVRQMRDNRVLPPRTHQPASRDYTFAGGFSYIHDGEKVWSTAYRYRPRGAQTERVFGMGYFKTVTEYRGLRVTRRVQVPSQPDQAAQDCPIRLDDPALLIDVQIENLGEHPVEILHYEYWDINLHQLKLQWLRAGLSGIIGDEERQILNQHFRARIGWDQAANALRFQQEPRDRKVDPQRISRIDWSPPGVFLADLSGKPDGALIDKMRFFGTGGPQRPDSVRDQRTAEALQASGVDPSMAHCLVLIRRLNIEAGGSADLRYAYGATPPGQTLDFLERYREATPNNGDQWKARLSYFDTGEDPVLKREMTWHAYYLLSATLYNAYYEAHRIPQGSAYLYLHGADGAARDLGLEVLALTYVRPRLAREMLCQMMMLRHGGTGALTYAFGGYGVHSDARGLHSSPSDLDLFFLMALHEYIGATGDLGFLQHEVEFYPRHNPNTLPPGAAGPHGAGSRARCRHPPAGGHRHRQSWPAASRQRRLVQFHRGRTLRQRWTRRLRD